MSPNLEGLVKWVNRPDWDESVDTVLALHMAVLNEYDLSFDQLIERIGEPAFCMLNDFAFEDFLASDPESGRNPIDVYLAKRGWKEPPATCAYLAALRDSVPSLYEVSDVRPGVSMLVRDLLRGGDRIMVEEKSATASLRDWDIMAGRVVTARGRTMMGGGVLLFDRATADGLVVEVNRLVEALRADHLQLATRRQLDIPKSLLSAAIQALDSIDVVLRSSAFVFSAAWLRSVIDRTDPANRPQVRTREGDEIESVALSFDFKPKVKLAQIRKALIGELSLEQADRNFWNWTVADSGLALHDAEGISVESRLDNFHLVLGEVEIRGRTVLLQTLSRARAERGAAMLTEVLEGLVLPPLERDPDEQPPPRAAGTERGRAPNTDPLLPRHALSSHSGRASSRTGWPHPTTGSRESRRKAPSHRLAQNDREWNGRS